MVSRPVFAVIYHDSDGAWMGCVRLCRCRSSIIVIVVIKSDENDQKKYVCLLSSRLCLDF